MTIIEQVIEILVDEGASLPPAEIISTHRIDEDLRLDSLEFWNIIMRLEETYGVELADHEASKMLTVGDIIEQIEHKLAE